jgi:hypothetical protein
MSTNQIEDRKPTPFLYRSNLLRRLHIPFNAGLGAIGPTSLSTQGAFRTDDEGLGVVVGGLAGVTSSQAFRPAGGAAGGGSALVDLVDALGFDEGYDEGYD